MTSLNYGSDQLSSMELYSLQLQKVVADFVDNDAISKQYVDAKVSELKTLLVGENASAALDSFKELQDYLTESGVAPALVSQIADISASVTTEKNRAEGVESTLSSSITTETTRAMNKENALQSELDATQTGIGLDHNGAYVAEAARNYISSATSLKSADALLDAALFTHVSEYKTEKKDTSEDRYLIRSEFKEKDDALDLRIDGLSTGSTQAVTNEAKTRSDEDAVLAGRIAILETDPTTQSAVSEVGESVQSETERAQGEEGRIEVKIDDQVSKQANDKTNADANLADEKKQREDADSLLSGRVDVFENGMTENEESGLSVQTAIDSLRGGISYVDGQRVLDRDDATTDRGRIRSEVSNTIINERTLRNAVDSEHTGRLDAHDLKHTGHDDKHSSHESRLSGHDDDIKGHDDDISGLGSRPYNGSGFDVQHNGTDDKYLYFSSKWRLYGDPSGKRLVFEYFKDGVLSNPATGEAGSPSRWVSAIPFISH